jgi:hypothetical protein
MSESEARMICTEAFKLLFGGEDRAIRFRAVFAVAQKSAAAYVG